MAPARAAPPAQRPHPSKLFVEVTTRCNLRCAMCVKYAPGQGIVEGDMTDETFERLAPAFPHLEALVLNGIGEPLLHRGLERFIARARADMPATGWIGFQTNGQLIGERRASSLVASGVDRICISADAVSPDLLRAIHGGARQDQVALRDGGAPRRGRTPGTPPGARPRVRGDAQQPPGAAAPRSLGGSPGLRLPHRDAHAPVRRGDDPRGRLLADDGSRPRPLRGRGVRAGRPRGSASPTTANRRASTPTTRSGVPTSSSAGWSMTPAARASRSRSPTSWRSTTTGSARSSRSLTRRARSRQSAGSTSGCRGPCRRRCGRATSSRKGRRSSPGTASCTPATSCGIGSRVISRGSASSSSRASSARVGERPLLDIWNDAEWRAFRGEVTRYEFPFCYDCNLALCDYVSEGDFEQDCHVGTVPCAACLWCTGPFQCLR